MLGQILYGFCNGYFGRDSYGEKRIEGIGVDWIVARDEDGYPQTATFNKGEDIRKLLSTWSIDKDGSSK